MCPGSSMLLIVVVARPFQPTAGSPPSKLLYTIYLIADGPCFLSFLALTNSAAVNILVFSSICSHPRLWCCFSSKPEANCPNKFLTAHKGGKKDKSNDPRNRKQSIH